MPTTPHWGLRYPLGTGPAPTPTQIKDLAEDIENLALPLSGTAAARPAANSLLPGRRYYATDTNTYSITTGAVWVTIETNGNYGLNNWHEVPDDPRGEFFITGAQGSAGVLYHMMRAGGATTVAGVSGSPNGVPDSTMLLNLLKLDPAELDIPGRQTQYSLKGFYMTNSTAPGSTFTLGLHQFTGISAGASAITDNVNDTPVAGSTHAIVAPAAQAAVVFDGPTFTIGSAGYYETMCRLSAATAAGSTTIIVARLMMKHVAL